MFTPPMNKVLIAEIAQHGVGFGIPKGAEPVLDDLHVAFAGIDFVDHLGAPASELDHLRTRARHRLRHSRLVALGVMGVTQGRADIQQDPCARPN